ncbi:hypothetical protein [Ramlibacter montanisoli]|uniref:Uncharacterized protein n=1 Tax=Ramlibacter montanisoli TaxID=2732512 RepID=A0A849KIU1_9BURK|nr:hypothetical protein [Ramlibacter montanisoli]NNU44755.1 hypothetical protein [Ramlibacter montanisoli]
MNPHGNPSQSQEGRNMNSKAWMVAAAVLAAGSAQATCYRVYGGDGSMILESSTTPVNLSQPIGDTVPEKFGQGAFMTVSDLTVFCKDRRGAGGQKTVAALQGKKGTQLKLKAPNSREAKELEAQLQALEAPAKPQEQGAAPEAAEKVAAE